VLNAYCHNLGPLQRDISSIAPVCIRDWRNRTKDLIRDKNISQLGESLCSSEGMLIGEPLRSLFHQPHFAYRFFPYWSYVIWQNDFYGINRCLKYFVVPDRANDYWNAQSNLDTKSFSWTKTLTSELNKFLGPVTIPESCAITHGIKYVKKYDKFEWFLHQSDAYLLGSLLTKEDDHCKYYGKANILLSYPTLNFSIIQRQNARRIINIQEVDYLSISFHS